VHDGVSESPDRYDTLDLSDNLIFAIDGGIRNIRRKRVLCDYTGIPLPSMKTMSDDLLFSVTKPSLFSFKTSLDVSLLPQQPLIDISNIELDLKKKISSYIFENTAVTLVILSNSLNQFIILFLLRHVTNHYS
ncbi:unnamed protein product, partial [Brassica oleracea]